MNIIQTPAKRAAVGLSAMSLFLPQNGVGEHYGAVDSPAPRPSTVDPRIGNAGSPHTRPTALRVGQTKTEHLNKNLREENFETMGGSLPCTPELPPDNEIDLSSYSMEDEELENDTRQLIGEFLKLLSGISSPRWNQSQRLVTMKRVVEDLLEKHRYAYNGMINKLSLDDRGDDVTVVGVVAKSTFEDGTTNWGRIASLLAFSVVICQYFMKKGRETCVEKVAQEIATYLLSDQRDWLVRNNAWDGFVDFFKVENPESKVRNTLMTVAGIAGIGATLAMLLR